MSEPPAKKPRFSFKKHKKNFNSSKRQFLEAGQRGFLATCNFHEKDCVREALNVLCHYADELYGPPKAIAIGPDTDREINSDCDGDIADELQKEIDASKATKEATTILKRRFRHVETGVPNCVFISTTLLNPVELGTRIITDVAQTGEKKTRYLLRLLPVDMVCHANMTDIMKAGNRLFDKYFLKGGTTFAIVFNKRYNNFIKREDVIHELAGLVQTMNMDNRVDLKNPEKTIVVEVIKGLCCMSVLPGYLKYKKYNLVELANINKKEKSATQAEHTEESEVAEKSIDEKYNLVESANSKKTEKSESQDEHIKQSHVAEKNKTDEIEAEP